MSGQRPTPSSEGRRIVICDYNALLLSVTGLLRMSNYRVFQAHDGLAAEELCLRMPDIALLVLNTYGTGIDVGSLVRRVRTANPAIQVLHIGSSIPDGLPEDVPTIPEEFTSEFLLSTVNTLLDRPSTIIRSVREWGDHDSDNVPLPASSGPILTTST
jgi:hypothetical protein